ncbi:MAG: XrtA/PEP-CTERM system TPR-repeat protein PrsT [Congregibacter sp.]
MKIHPNPRRGPGASAALQTLRAICLLMLGTAAVLQTQTSLAQSFDSAEEYYEDASSKVVEGDASAAIIQLKNALKMDAEHLPSLMLLGQTLLIEGSSWEASLILSEAMLGGADPQQTVPLLIEAYQREGLHAELLAQITPDAVPSWLRADVEGARAQTYAALGNLIAAKEAIGRALAMDPGNMRARLARVTVYLRDKRWEEASVEAQQLIALAPEDTRAWNSHGSILHATGQLEPAIDAYRRAIDLSPRNLDARIALISIYMDLQRESEAAPHLAYTAENFPYEPRGAYFAALAAARIGDSDAEAKALSTVIDTLNRLPTDTVSSNPQLLMVGALAHFGRSEYAQSNQYIESYLVLNADDPGAQRLRAVNLLSSGEPGRAKQVLLKLQRRYSGDIGVTSLLATAYAQEGHHNKAAELLLGLEGAGSGVLQSDSQLGLSLINTGEIVAGIKTLEAVRKSQAEGSTRVDFQLATAYIRSNRAEEAVELLQSLTLETPSNLGYQNLLAIAYLQAGNTNAAKESFTGILRTDPAFLPSAINLARIAMRENDFGEAQRWIDYALDLSPESPRAMFEQATLFKARGEFTDAIRWAERTTQLDRSNMRYAQMLSELYLSTGDTEAAEASARRAAVAGKDDPAGQALLGQTLAAVGKAKQAGLVYTLMARNADFDTPTLYRIAVLQADLGLYESAILSLAAGLKGNAKHQRSLKANMRMHLAAKHFEKTVALADEYKVLYPQDPTGQLLAGEAWLRLDRPKDAAKRFQSALSLGAQADGTLGLYRAFFGSGRIKEAEKALADYLEEGGNDPRLLAAKADLLIAQERWSDAELTLTKVLQQFPNSVAHLNNRALARLNLGEPGALADARAAVDLAQDNAAVNDTLGWILVQNGKPDEALSFLREATSRETDNPTLRFHLAVALAKLGRQKEALNELYLALETGRDFDERSKATALQTSLRD